MNDVLADEAIDLSAIERQRDQALADVTRLEALVKAGGESVWYRRAIDAENRLNRLLVALEKVSSHLSFAARTTLDTLEEEIRAARQK